MRIGNDGCSASANCSSTTPASAPTSSRSQQKKERSPSAAATTWWLRSPTAQPRRNSTCRRAAGGRSSRSPTQRSSNASLKPGREEVLDVFASAGEQTSLHAAVLDHAQRRQLFDAKLLRELGPLVDVDVVDLERFVVPASLEHLREVRLDAAATARLVRVEEDEARLLALQYRLRQPNPPFPSFLEGGS